MEDRPIVALLQRAEPTLDHFIILQRIAVDEKLNLVIMFGTSQPIYDISSFGLGWNSADRLGLFLQERADAGQVYQLAIKPGPNDDCSVRIERITAHELVLACSGEKGETYDNQKFIFDIRAKSLVKSFSYPPFSVFQILQGPLGPQFVMSDTQQLLLVDVGGDAHTLRVVSPKQVRITLSRIPMQESTIQGDRVYYTPQLPGERPPAFGPGKRFRLSNEKNKHGSDSLIVVEKVSPKEKIYPLPQSDHNIWRLARPDDIANRTPSDYADINEQIGPHQLENGRLWFGKTFYNGEGSSGVGGFGYFDAATRSYRLYSPPEIQRWSVSSILVETNFIWLALVHRGEYGGNSGGLLRWNRKTERARLFSVSTYINKIVRHDNALYLGAVDGIDVLRDDQIQSYFVDRNTDGQYQIVAREGSTPGQARFIK